MPHPSTGSFYEGTGTTIDVPCEREQKTQDAWVYSNDGPIRHTKYGYPHRKSVLQKGCHMREHEKGGIQRCE
eukprot:7676386-Pyramimonas_sp.AAC.1